MCGKIPRKNNFELKGLPENRLKEAKKTDVIKTVECNKPQSWPLRKIHRMSSTGEQ